MNNRNPAVKIVSLQKMNYLRKSLLSGKLRREDFNSGRIDRRELSKIKQIIIHCSDSPNEKTTIQDINEWHKKRGWAGCGYHYFIQSNGNVYQGRAEGWVGSHCRNHNSNSIGICVNGRDVFHIPQQNSLKWLLINIIGRLRAYDLMRASDVTNLSVREAIEGVTPASEQNLIYPKIYSKMPIFGHNYYDKGKTCPNFIVPYFLLTGLIIPYKLVLL